jgi:hypothetical protein
LRIERWKFNKEYGVYVSTLGNFKSKDKKDLHIKINNKGYCIVRTPAYKNRILAHRLVMLTWRPNLDAENLTVDHLDHNKRNNSVANLEWVTDNENKNHSSIERGGTQRPKKSVVVTKKNTGEKFFFEGVKIAERTLNLDHGTVMRILRGKQISHRGYCIAYANGGDA